MYLRKRNYGEANERLSYHHLWWWYLNYRELDSY